MKVTVCPWATHTTILKSQGFFFTDKGKVQLLPCIYFPFGKIYGLLGSMSNVLSTPLCYINIFTLLPQIAVASQGLLA